MGDRPNVLILMSDQHNPHVLGCAGDQVARTPNLDALAERGVLFENAYCQSPLCVPSRMSFLTGQQCSKVRVWTNSCVLPSDMTTFAHALGAVGYETSLIGRMHFVGADQWHGFEERLVGSLTAIYHGGAFGALTPELAKGTGQRRSSVLTAGPGRTGYQVYDEEVGRTTAEWLHRKAERGGRPFCVVAGFVLPHCPFVCHPEDWDYYYERVEIPDVPEGYFEQANPILKEWRGARDIEDLTQEQIRRARAGYYGIVTHLDRQVGHIMNALGESGLDRDTVVIYISDHGDMAGEHGMWWKSNFFDGGVGVPLIISGPGEFHQGAKVREVVGLTDIAPTLTDLAGTDPLPDGDGRSLVPLCSGDTAEWSHEVFSELGGSAGLPPARMIRRGRWKFIHY
ncbi:MAG: sulfatase-like hydrolase/transferase, partial [Candidatus Brocadiia bacterium]